MFLTLVIVYYFHIMRVARFEGKANPPPPIDRHGPLIFAVALQFVQANTFQRAQILQTIGDIESRKKFYGSFFVKPTKTSPSQNLRVAAFLHD
jgi:hypothetical protein